MNTRPATIRAVRFGSLAALYRPISPRAAFGLDPGLMNRLKLVLATRLQMLAHQHCIAGAQCGKLGRVANRVWGMVTFCDNVAVPGEKRVGINGQQPKLTDMFTARIRFECRDQARTE